MKKIDWAIVYKLVYGFVASMKPGSHLVVDIYIGTGDIFVPSD